MPPLPRVSDVEGAQQGGIGQGAAHDVVAEDGRGLLPGEDLLGVDADGDVRAQLAEALSRHDAAHWQAWGEERGIPLTALASPTA